MATGDVDPRELAIRGVATGDRTLMMQVVHWMEDLTADEANWLALAVQYGLNQARATR